VALLCLPLAAHTQFFPQLLEQKFHGTERNDYPKRILKGSRGKYYILGYTDDPLGHTDGLIMCLDSLDRVIWRKQFPGTGFDEIYDGYVNDQGEVYFAGVTGSNIPHFERGPERFYADYFIGKLGPEGEQLWVQTLGGSDKDVAFAICPTNFDGMLVTGSSWSRDGDVMNNDPPLNNQWVVMLNRFGKVLRQFSLGGIKNDWGTSACRSQDGGFLLAGVTNSEDLDGSSIKHNGDAWFVKVDFAGQVEWEKILKRPYEDVIYRVVPNKYGLFVAVGSQVTEDNGKQFWLLKLDDRGNVVVDEVMGDKGIEELLSVAVTFDGGMIMTGYSSYRELKLPQLKGRKDLWVIRTASDGKVIWKKAFGGPGNEIGVDVMEYAPGLYYVLGQKENHFNPKKESRGEDFWLLKIAEVPCREVLPEITTDIGNYRDQVNTPIKFFNNTPFGDSWLWDFGDGSTSTDKSPTKLYSKPGVYTVRLTVTLNESCKSTYIYPKPVIINR
jgi:hypothetical protein